MKEIGGYIEFETSGGHALHEEMIGLNCGRSGLAYLIETKRIRAIALPYFLCASVKELCEKMKLRICYYRTGMSFLPQNLELKSDEWLYAVNYYGQMTAGDAAALKTRYGRVILDNSQAYFDEPISGIDTIYTCRKYFGVPDGAFLSTDVPLERPLPEDFSAGRMGFLLGRFEGKASDYYDGYVKNNAMFADEPVKKISALTMNLLRSIDYERVEKRRTANFRYLHERLKERNMLKLRVPSGAFAYPLMVNDAPVIRRKLIEQKIYVPLLWPNVVLETEADSVDRRLAESVLPLPCDQRYDEEDMARVADAVLALI